MRYLVCSAAFLTMFGFATASVAGEQASPAKPSVDQLDQGAQVEQVAPGIWRIRFGQVEPFTPVTMRQDAPASSTKALAALPAGELPFPATAIRFRTLTRGCAVDLPMDKSEQIFGFGLQMLALNHTDKRLTIRTSDQQPDFPGYGDGGSGDSHAPVPFYVSSRGYGVLVDTLRYVSFYCGNLARAETAVTDTRPAVAPDDSVEELYRIRKLAQQVMCIDVPLARGVDIYVMAGPTPMAAVQRYNLFSGGGCLPPLWGLGMYYRAHSQSNAAQVLKFAKDFRESHIPCDNFGLEPGWHSASYSCSFTWDHRRWPDPEGFIKSMTDMNYKLNLWEHAFTHPSSPLYGPLKPFSGDYLVWNGLVPDFATPQAREIFGGYHERELVRKGIAGFKIDECDNQPLSASPWSFPERSVFPSGLDGEQMHAMLGLLHQRMFDAIYRRNNLRTYGKVRASHALASPMPYVLYSDVYDHRDYVRGTVNSGFSGLLWNPEVRQTNSLEDLYRRTQTSVFSAQAVMDAWFLRNPPWRQIDKAKNNRGELLPNWKESEAVCRKLFELRMSLIPYLYSAFAGYRETGVPPLRALVMDYPDDAKTWKVDDEYMMGKSLLVAPLFAGKSKRSVYLPKGEWYDFWTHEKHEGSQKIEVEKGIEQIPVFVRGDSLLPLAKPIEYITPETCFEITVHVFGSRPAPFTLYEDDGVSYDFERGKQNRIGLTWEAGKGAEKKSGGYTGPARYKILAWKAAP